MNRITIIGSGIASRTLARELLKKDNFKIEVFTRDKFPYSRMAILEVLKGEVKKDNIELIFPGGVTLYTEKEVIKIDADNKILVFRNGGTHHYETLVIATGARPRRLNIQGNGIPVITVRNIEDIEKMDALLKDGKKRVLIAGGGFVSMEAANALYKRGACITIVVSSGRILSRMLPSETSEFVEQRILQKGVRIVKNTNIQGIRNGRVFLDNGTDLEIDFVVIGKGVSRELPPIESDGKIHKEYDADSQFRTQFPDVYLIGDALLTRDLITGKKRHNAIWPIAEKQARILAQILTGSDVHYNGDVAYNMLSVFDMYIFVIGNLHEGTLKTNLKTDSTFYAVSEKQNKIIGIAAINHPLPYARIVKRFSENGYYS